MGYVYAVTAAYAMHLRSELRFATVLNLILASLPLVIVVAWVADTSPSTRPLAYISLGVVLIPVWNWTIFRTGWSLSSEYDLGTMDHTLVSRTPILVVILGKAMANIAMGIPAGLIGFLVVLLVSAELVDISSPLLVFVSMCFAILTVLSVSFAFSPLFMLVRGRAGFFNAIIPLGVVLSGFLYPVSQLSSEVEVIARFLPTSWAMDAIIRSIEPGGSTLRIAGDWGVAMALSAVYLATTYLMLRVVEKKIRVSGSLGSF